MKRRTADVVIVGGGIAGLMTAHYLSQNRNVTLLTKSKLTKSNSSLAQGGIAAAVADDDHWSEHLEDTMVAGNYHNDEKNAELLVQKGSQLIRELIELGVNFDIEQNGAYSLGLEGAHTKRRILHAGGDQTGKAIVTSMMKTVLPVIEVCEETYAYDLIVNEGICQGIYTLDSSGMMEAIEANVVVLATGGVGQLYSVTSNCEEATGDGIAMAYRAGAELCDMEFLQFHPTIFQGENNKYHLISEAVRGEGARLITESGELLMAGKHPLEDLAPRDIVSREIYRAKQKGHNTYMNIAPIKDFPARFPSIYESICSQQTSTSASAERVNVEPGAHFLMGGIKVNDLGETTISNLYAVGECAYTGVHGANRLASNSLLEAVVYGERTAKAILKKEGNLERRVISKPLFFSTTSINLPSKEEIQSVMDRYVGIIRTKEMLEIAVEWFNQFVSMDDDTKNIFISANDKTIFNMLIVGRFIALSALKRTESRGAHYREDYPVSNDHEWLGYRTIIANGKLTKEAFNFIQQKSPISTSGGMNAILCMKFSGGSNLY